MPFAEDDGQTEIDVVPVFAERQVISSAVVPESGDKTGITFISEMDVDERQIEIHCRAESSAI